MDRFESMSAFVAVAEAGGFSAAARRLGTPLATISRKVTDLEQALKVRLINRTTRQITLTEPGEVYLASARRILETLADAERTASGEYAAPRGGLTLTAPIAFGRLHVLPVVLAFLRAYPEVDVTLLLSDQVMNIMEEHIDLAVRGGDLPDSSMIAVRLGQIRMVICASPEYLRRHGRPERPEDLLNHDCVIFSAPPFAREWRLKVNGKVVPVPIRSRLAVTTAEAAIAAAAAGAGLTQLRSYQVFAPVQQGTLELVMREFEIGEVPFSFVYPSGRLVPLKLRAFLDFAAPRIRERIKDL